MFWLDYNSILVIIRLPEKSISRFEKQLMSKVAHNGSSKTRM